MKFFATLAAFSSAALFASSAAAGNLYAGPSGPQATDSSITLAFDAPTATTTALSFVVDGYLSLDGDNFYEDDFGLTLNGKSIFSGTFNLGGGSDSTQAVVYANPYGATVSKPTNNGTGVGWNGGHERIAFGNAVPLAAGLNTLDFSYVSLPQPGHAGFQGLGDEGRGVEKVRVGAVPEPSTWAMMGLGFAGLAYAGMAHGRRKRLEAVLA